MRLAYNADPGRNVRRSILAVCAGVAWLVAQPAGAHIGDLVFCDANGNGVFEPPDDVGIQGVTVTMTCPQDTSFNATTVTNAQGRYLFANNPLTACTVTVDQSTLPFSSPQITTPLLNNRPLPTAEHSPFPGYTNATPGVVCAGMNPAAMTTAVIADGVFSTTVNNLAGCQDPACTSAADPCITVTNVSPPFFGYYGDDFGFLCAPPTRAPIPVVASPTSASGIVLIAGLGAVLWLSLQRLRRSA